MSEKNPNRKRNVKKTKIKQKQKQKQQQNNKQTIKLNITTSGGSGGSGGASQMQKPQYLPNSFVNEEHTTLLKSINEQLKQKNEPVSTAIENFNIPEKKTTFTFGTQTEQPVTSSFATQTAEGTNEERKEKYSYGTQTKQPKRHTNETQTEYPLKRTYETQTDFPPTYSYGTQTDELINYNGDEEFKRDLERKLKDIPPQFTEKVALPPVITPKLNQEIPIIDKPKELSGLNLMEQVRKKTEERNQRTDEEVLQMEEKINENKPQKSTDSPLKQALKKKVEERVPRTEEEVIQLEEEIKKKRGRPKLTEEEKQKRSALISQKAFNVLLNETPENERGSLIRQFEVDDLSDANIKTILKNKYRYSADEIKRIFSFK